MGTTARGASSIGTDEGLEPQIVMQALTGGGVERPPYWFMRQAGRFLPEYRAVRASVSGFMELCLTPELATQVTLQPVERFDTDAAIVFADILIVPYALGRQVEVVEGTGPRLQPVRAARELAQLDIGGTAENWAPVLETIARVRAKLPAEKVLIGFAGAPWTVATYMVEGSGSRDFNEVRQWAYKDPAGFSQLIDILTQTTITYLRGQADAGADVLQLFDTWAGVLPPGEREHWVIHPTRKIVAALRSTHPEVPVIGFARGLGASLQDYVTITKLSAIGLDTTTDPHWARRVLGPSVCLQGNLDPWVLLAGGAPMRDAATAIVSALGSGRFIFNLGHGILPQTPPDHLSDLVSILRGWRLA